MYYREKILSSPRSKVKVIWQGGDRNTGFILGKALQTATDRWIEIEIPSEPAEGREGLQHREARKIVQFYLESKGRIRSDKNTVRFKREFIKEKKLGNRFPGHSYDIMTDKEIVEIDDLSSHPKKAHQINDNIAEEYISRFHPEYKFYRLLKEEIANRRGWIQPDCLQYLKEHLF